MRPRPVSPMFRRGGRMPLRETECSLISVPTRWDSDCWKDQIQFHLRSNMVDSDCWKNQIQLHLRSNMVDSDCWKDRTQSHFCSNTVDYAVARQNPVSPMFRRAGRCLFERPTFRLKFYELARDVVATSLRENPQHSPAGLVEVDAPRQRTPQRAARSLDDVSHLKDGQTDDAILAGEAVVPHAEVKFVAVRVRLTSQRTVAH